MTRSHYTAVLQVEEVTVTEAVTVNGRGYPADHPTPERREVIEVGKIVVRADTLDGLKEKLAAHATLL